MSTSPANPARPWAGAPDDPSLACGYCLGLAVEPGPRLEPSGGAFIALSRREVGTKHVERPFKVRQAFADLGTFPGCFGKARVDPVTEPTEPGDHGCSGGDTDGDDSDQHCDPFNRQRNPPAAKARGAD